MTIAVRHCKLRCGYLGHLLLACGLRRESGSRSRLRINNETAALHSYLPTTRMAKVPGFILPRRSPGAGGSNSALGRKNLCVFRSKPMVRAVFFVGTFSTTVYLSAESS